MKNLCLAAALAVLTGCQAVPDDGVHVVQPRDIPVPAGMVLKTYLHRSDTLENGDYRYANLVYEGATPVAQVAAYMRERMPQHSYRLVSQERKDRIERMVFERGEYLSTCTIEDLDHGSRLLIQLRTHPRL